MSEAIQTHTAHRCIRQLLLVLLSATAAQSQSPVAPQSFSAADSAVVAPPATEIPPADPARPTVTTPAHLPPPGYLQFEQGFVEAADSGGSPGIKRQFSLVQTTKLALNHYVLIQAADQPFAHTQFLGNALSNDTGDLLLGAQVLLTDENEGYSIRPTIAFGYNRRVRTGTSADLDIGSYAQGALALMSGSIHGLHYDTNVIVNEQEGQNTAGQNIRRAQFGQSLSITRQLNKPFSITSEVWHFTQPLVFTNRRGEPVRRSNAVGAVFALGYTVRPNLVFDAAIDHGLTSTSTAWEGLAGFTYLLPHRLWSRGRR